MERSLCIQTLNLAERMEHHSTGWNYIKVWSTRYNYIIWKMVLKVVFVFVIYFLPSEQGIGSNNRFMTGIHNLKLK